MTAAPTRQPPRMLTPRGPLCEDSIGAFEADLAETAGEVVVDLTEVTVFSAAAMRVVAEARRRGITVRLVNPSELTAQALEVVGLATN
ncbi:MAG TPA: STAS domain-containing protein [Acidimicrobiales bacterium]|nr:STAS domain-containing protein [Acidimicrobiales bacterium]